MATPGSLHVIDLTQDGFLYKPNEGEGRIEDISADMAREALDSLFADPNSTSYENVDSRAAQLIGSRGQKPVKASHVASFQELAKAGAKFDAASTKVKTVSSEPMRIVEALDRGVDIHSDYQPHTYARHPEDEAKKSAKSPVKAKAPEPVPFGMHDFDGVKEPRLREPLIDSLTFFVHG